MRSSIGKPLLQTKSHVSITFQAPAGSYYKGERSVPMT
jgi:hypothetical protein